jgi:MtN3 and saliva related transmembrane protein
MELYLLIYVSGGMQDSNVVVAGEVMAAWFEGIGSVAAFCTTACWIPQAVKIIREKRTEGISLITQSVFTFGIALWAIYGFLLNNRPVLYANIVTLVLSVIILILKLRYPHPL